MASRLLIVSCSQSKRPSTARLSAIERYDGPIFRLVRKFRREYGMHPGNPDAYILSARYGLIPGEAEVPIYDSKMTSARANELRPVVLGTLAGALERTDYAELFISVGAAYERAINGYQNLISQETTLIISSGAMGRRLAQLHDWLYSGSVNDSQGEQIAHQRRGGAKIKGITLDLSANEVLELARQALDRGVGEPEKYESWFVLVDGRPVAPKWLVSQLTGLPVRSFHTTDARRFLDQLGVEVQKSDVLHMA